MGSGSDECWLPGHNARHDDLNAQTQRCLGLPLSVQPERHPLAISLLGGSRQAPGENLLGGHSNVRTTSEGNVMSSNPSTPEELYLDLLKRFLTRYHFDSPYRAIGGSAKVHRRLVVSLLQRPLRARALELVRRTSFDAQTRREGRDYPVDAETLIGLRRLDNLQHCVTELLRQRIKGDLMETGVWRGGASILMAGILRIYGGSNRLVWVADSFRGVPPPDPEHYPADAGILSSPFGTSPFHWKRSRQTSENTTC